MKKYFFLFFVLLLTHYCFSQSVFGKTQIEVIRIVNKKHPNHYLSTKKTDYLVFSPLDFNIDDFENSTLYFFTFMNEICTSERRVLPIRHYNDFIEEFNTNPAYTKSGINTWQMNKNDKTVTYEFIIENDKKTFSVIIWPFAKN